MNMRVRPTRLCLIGILAAGVSCRQNQDARRNRITAGRATQYCRPDACFNPHILASEREFYITTFVGKTPVRARVAPRALRDYLIRLPVSVWPRGPEILISPEDDVYDGRAVQQNVLEAQSICRELGLDVQLRMGG